MTGEHASEVADNQQDTANNLPPHERTSNGNANATRSIPSEDLFRGQRELLIEHSGEIYRLRLTRNGKLILNK